ncbi:MAG: TetR/AcrR family transcriptional regulator [Deltaproteobacteria bacterium]|nr:TetR/AcrR family transcriptional regulator [Deltaproteobacteria bacterium]
MTSTTISPHKREALLDAALALFAERGFHGTTVPEVAERAKVATGTLYRYFEDKDALVNAVFRRCNEQLQQAVVEGFPTDAAVREQFVELWRRLWKFAEERPAMLDFLELHDHETYIDDYSRECQGKLLQPIVALLTDAQAKQIVKPLAPMMLWSMMWGAFAGLYKGVRKGRLKIDAELVTASEAAVWHALRL